MKLEELEIANKKRNAGAALGEILELANTLKLCAEPWTHHAHGACPPDVESNALPRAFINLSAAVSQV